jgi:hypothetical protein
MLQLYGRIEGWVDRQWRAEGLRFKVLLFPAILPLLLAGLMGAERTHLPYGFGWFGLWNIFVFWRYWRYLKLISEEGDRSYDDEGKFRLAKEYHDTESATAAAKRRRREGD